MSLKFSSAAEAISISSGRSSSATSTGIKRPRMVDDDRWYWFIDGENCIYVNGDHGWTAVDRVHPFLLKSILSASLSLRHIVCRTQLPVRVSGDRSLLLAIFSPILCRTPGFQGKGACLDYTPWTLFAASKYVSSAVFVENKRSYKIRFNRRVVFTSNNRMYFYVPHYTVTCTSTRARYCTSRTSRTIDL